MKRILSLLVILAAVIIALLLFVKFVHVRAPFSLTAGSSDFSLTTAQLHENTDTYALNAQYPQFGIPSVDAAIKQAVESAADDIRTSPPNPPDSAVKQNTFDGTYDKVYVGSDIISLELVLSEYTGGAHPFTLFKGLTFDRSTGKQLTLDDVLQLTGLTLPQVAAQASAQLQQGLGDGFQFKDGATATADNYAESVVDAKNVTFIFQQYQVAAYAAGQQYVSIPRR